MKNILTISILAVILVLGILFIIPKSNISSNIGADDISDRFKWLKARLQDPATGEIPRFARSRELAYAHTLPGSIGNIKTKYDRMLSNRWDTRGPINVGGRTRALALDVTNENIILAGGVSGGIWRSTDAGISWNRSTGLDQIGSVSCVVQDKRKGKEKTWYYGTGEFWGNSAAIPGNGIYKSVDGGLTWSVLQATALGDPVSWDNPFDYIWNIVTNHKNISQDEVLAATTAGSIERSTDGGNSWNIVLGGYGNDRSYFTDIAITPSGVFYATLSQKAYDAVNGSKTKGIYRSTDGLNWVDITPQFIPKLYNRIVIGVAPSDENQVYFVAETPGSGKLTFNLFGDSLWHSFWKYTYVSGDGTAAGAVWEDRSQNLPKPANVRGHFNSQGSYDLVISVKPNNPDVVFVGASSFYRSDDGFKTPDNYKWIGGYCLLDTCTPTFYRYTNHHPDLHAITFLPSNPDIMFTGSDGGIHKTLDDKSSHPDYIDLSRGYFTTQFYTVAIEHTLVNNQAILGGLQDNGSQYTVSSGLGVDWTSPTSSDGFNCAIADGGNIIYTSHNSFYQPKIKIWRSTIDANGNVLTQSRIDPSGGRDFIWNTPFKLDPNDNNKMYLAGGKIIWRNNNLSDIPFVNSKDSTVKNWDSLSNTRISDGFITSVGISKKPANILYYGTSKGKIFRIDNANTGDPKPIDISGKAFSTGYINCITVDPYDGKKVLAVFNNYGVISIFSTTDEGSSWVAVSGNLEQYSNGSGDGPAVNWVSILPIKGRNLYLAGTSTGLYSTANINGTYTVWTQEGAESIGNTVVDMIDTRETDGMVVVGTHGMGVFSCRITDLPQVPSTPTLTFPIDKKRGILSSSQLKWNTVSDAVFYKVELSKSAAFDSIFQVIDGLSTTETTVANLDQGEVTYYWRVFAENSAGVGISSAPWTFVTALSAPSLTYPALSADSIPTDINFQWNKVNNATSYHFVLSNILTFGTKIVDKVVNENSFIYSTLLPGKRYYWHVSSINSDGEGIFSPNSVFKTLPSTDVNSPEFHEFSINNVYPNPARDYLTIELNMPESGEINYIIMDTRGNFIDNKSINYNSSSPFMLINTKYLSSGSYIIIIKFKKDYRFTKFDVIK